MTAATLDPAVHAPAAPVFRQEARPSRFGPGWTASALGLITAAMQCLIWRSLSGVPEVSDEASYVLQARLFAHFRWTAPPPPIREFFEQGHVLVSPVIASKYPPGHALLLTLGVWLGAPGLVPVLLAGVTAGLLFAITRRLTNGRTALLAWLLWTFAPLPQVIRPSYFSESTTAATWVLGGWALLRWRDDRRLRWLVVVSVATAWCAITRPVTAVAYAIPMGLATLALLRRRHAWQHAGVALLAGIVVVTIIPLWSWRTLGSPSHTPYLAYNQTYVPYEHLGFGDNGGRTPTWLPPDTYGQLADFAGLHARYTPATLPRELRDRTQSIWTDYFGGARWSAVFGLFVPVGLLALGAEGLIAGASVVALLLTYLSYAHDSGWTLYYYEALAPLCLLAAAGFAYVVRLARRGPSFERRAIVTAVIVSLPFALATAGRIRFARAQTTVSQASFAKAMTRLPHPAIVFVRYAPNHPHYASLINNDPDLAHAAVWTVSDLGETKDARLRAIAPERHAFLYDQATGTFIDLDETSTR